MDGRRFDGLTKRVAMDAQSRRGLLRALAGGALGAAFGAVGARPAAAACRQNGRTCNPDKPRQCCSGICKKSGRDGGKCRPAPGAKGCTNRRNGCRGRRPFPCPDAPEGVCVIDLEGRPFCINDGECIDCKNDRVCVRQFGRGARCVVCRTECKGLGTRNRACVIFRRNPP